MNDLGVKLVRYKNAVVVGFPQDPLLDSIFLAQKKGK